MSGREKYGRVGCGEVFNFADNMPSEGRPAGICADGSSGPEEAISLPDNCRLNLGANKELRENTVVLTATLASVVVKECVSAVSVSPVKSRPRARTRALLSWTRLMWSSWRRL